MSFSKAKRFNYKKPELTPSPADYAITTPLEKGCKISKSERFEKRSTEEDTSPSCSRTSSRCCSLRSSTPKSEHEYDMKHDLDSLKKKVVELNRDDIFRQSIRKESFEAIGKPKTSNFNSLKYARNGNDLKRHSLRKKSYKINEKPKVSKSNSSERSNNTADNDFEQFYLPRHTALQDHDYCRFGREGREFRREGRESFEGNARSNASSSNSSENNDDINRNLHFHVLEEFIDDDLISSEKLDYQEPMVIDEFEHLRKDFEELEVQRQFYRNNPMARKLFTNIDNNMESVRTDLAKVHSSLIEKKKRRTVEGEKCSRKMCLPGSSKHEEINSIIKCTMQFLQSQFEMHGKSLGKDTQERIRGLFTDIFVTSEKSTEQIHACCNKTADHLSRHINRTLNITPLPVLESNPVYRHSIDDRNVQNFNDYDDENDLYFPPRFGDTEETLKLQESIIDALKDELADLKKSLCDIKLN